MSAMGPVVVTAHLESAPELSGIVHLDGVLLWAFGSELGAQETDGWRGPAEVVALAEGPEGLPLARVGVGGVWWWACSAVVPRGREARTYLHTRAPMEFFQDHPGVGTVNTGSGPDKSLRVPRYSRPEMRVMQWTAIGDADRIRELLTNERPSIGRRTTHGCGKVSRWVVESVDAGPTLDDYATDPTLRAVPRAWVSGNDPIPPNTRWDRLPPRSPYHLRDAAVTCLVPT
jgi:hypothetical protein